MSSFWKHSEATSIAVHAAVLAARTPGEPVRIRDIAEVFGFSAAHLAKVLNRLVRAHILTATRGPAGGFRLARPAESVTLAEIYTAIEGGSGRGACLFSVPACAGSACPLNGFFGDISRRIDEYLTNTTLAMVAHATGFVEPSLPQEAVAS